MWQALAWKILVALWPTVLGVSRDAFNVAVEAVKAAEADPNLNTMTEKEKFVSGKLVAYVGTAQVPKRVIDALLVIAVNLVKSST